MISNLQGRMTDCPTAIAGHRFKIDHSRVSVFVKRRGLKKGEMQGNGSDEIRTVWRESSSKAECCR
jgi:hypothetical protein